jgi:hypothetical protein
MAQFGQVFYTAQLPKEASREALPAGEYIAVLDKAEIKTTKSGDGQYIDCQYKVVDGQHKGNGFFDKINISNPNPVSVEIGLARLNTILTIGGLSQCGSTEELEHARIHILAVLGVEEYNGNKKNRLIAIKNPNAQVKSPQPTMQPITQQSYVAQQPIQAQPVYQQPIQAQPQAPVQQQQYAPVAQQPIQQWQSQPQQPVAPSIQSTSQMLNDEIPFN